MSRFDSIVLPLDGSPEAAKGVSCAAWLSARLGATLHVLHSGVAPLARAEALSGLRAEHAERATTVLHQTTDEPSRAVRDAVAEHAATLVVMSARGESASVGVEPERSLGRVARVLLEESAVPVLLIPVRYREALPWTSMLIAASGEPAADQALEAAVRLSNALGLRASVVYVEEGGHRAGPLARYADAAHHEYSERLDEMVRRALACCANEDCRCIDEVLVRRGDPADELLGELERRESSVLALGWHGALGATRAPVLSRLLERAECPLLVIREQARPRARLKVGDEIGAGPSG